MQIDPAPADVPEIWAAPTGPPATMSPAVRPTRAATALGVVGLIVGGIVFIVTWALATLSVSYCSTDHTTPADITSARSWMLAAAVVWMAGPAWAGWRYRSAGRTAVVWWVFVGTVAAIGLWAIIAVQPWSLCFM